MTHVVITEHGVSLVPPCPPWCTLPADHDVDDLFSQDVGGLLRHHGREWKPAAYPLVAVELTWTERIGYGRGEGPAEPPRLCLFADDTGTGLTPAQARDVAALLLAAADFYEQSVA